MFKSLLRAPTVTEIKTALTIGTILPVVAFTIYVIYNLYFSPLRIYPGPKLSAATPFPYIKALVSGKINYYTLEVHEKYGDAVRLSPIHISYISAQAWKDIYERRQNHALLEKEPEFFIHPGKDLGKGIPSIVTAPHAMHGRMRRLLSHAFSEKALRGQESLIKIYIDLMMDRLRSYTESAKVVDIVSIFNWTTFDIIGDLTFGESFECLKTEKNHPWIETTFSLVKMPALLSAATFIPGITKVALAIAPASLKADFIEIFEFTTRKVHERMSKQTDRADFMTSIMEFNDEKGMTIPEIESSANHIIAGGAETTASALSGGVYYLLKNKYTLDSLVAEIRGEFKSEEEITLLRVSGLPILSATINEIMRLYPPFPIGFPRVVPKGGEIIVGKYVPSGTIVSVNHYAAYHSESNFRDPFGFHPERFLGDQRFDLDEKRAFNPFSVGPRNCIGKNLAWFEMRMIMARILYRFDMELPQSSDKWGEGQEQYVAVLKPPLQIRLKQVSEPAIIHRLNRTET